jgi:hypothetical protein
LGEDIRQITEGLLANILKLINLPDTDLLHTNSGPAKKIFQDVNSR